MSKRCSTLLFELEHVMSKPMRHPTNYSSSVSKCLSTSADAGVLSRKCVKPNLSPSLVPRRSRTSVIVGSLHNSPSDGTSRSGSHPPSSCHTHHAHPKDPSAASSDPKNIASTAGAQLQFYRRPLPDSCISFGSLEGMALFAEAQTSGHMFTYFPLASQFRTQDDPAFCGLSTLVMALNALEVDPQRVWKAPWRFFHENMLDCCIPLETVQQTGITMDQFACLAACNTLHVKMVRTGETSSESDFRSAVSSGTRRTDQVIVSSYSRSALDQTGEGHFSPIGGYHPGRDLVLIMDTARFKYPPHWVSLSRLFSAMQQIDTASGLARGYFILTKSQVRPAILFRLSSSLSPLVVERSNSGMLKFLQAWQAWLVESFKGRAVVEAVKAAIQRLLVLVELIDENSSILTTHSTLSTEAEIQVANHDHVRRLTELIQKLEIFHLVNETLASSACPSIAKFGTSGIGLILGSENCTSIEAASCKLHSSTSSAYDAVQLVSNNVEAVQEHDRIELKASHYIAILLLSWPYHRCNSNTFGLALQRYMTSQLSSVGWHEDFELLQNETARLRQHLSNIINYTGRLNHCGHSG